MRTYQTLYQNEIRAIEITINQQDGTQFIPSGAYVTILRTADSDNAYAGTDYTDTVVIAEQAAQVNGNSVSTLIGTTTTANVGTYKILWKILRSTYTYYHVTDLEVVEP